VDPTEVEELEFGVPRGVLFLAPLYDGEERQADEVLRHLPLEQQGLVGVVSDGGPLDLHKVEELFHLKLCDS
jgi:hypothetical protein